MTIELFLTAILLICIPILIVGQVLALVCPEILFKKLF